MAARTRSARIGHEPPPESFYSLGVNLSRFLILYSI